MRKFGDVTSDLELVLEEMIEQHDVQAGEILNLVYGWIKIHRPDALEVYTDDFSNPEFHYGHRREK